jgi:hypothetical protein
LEAVNMANFEREELMREYESAVAGLEEAGFEEDTFTSVEYAKSRSFGERKARKHIHMGIDLGILEPIFTPRKTVHGIVMRVPAYRIIRPEALEELESGLT